MRHPLTPLKSEGIIMDLTLLPSMVQFMTLEGESGKFEEVQSGMQSQKKSSQYSRGLLDNGGGGGGGGEINISLAK